MATSPRSTRPLWLERLQAVVESDLWALLELHAISGEPVVSGLSVWADATPANLWARCGPGKAARGPWGASGARDRFERCGESAFEAEPALRELYTPLDLRWQAAMPIFDGAHVVALLLTVRLRHRPDFSPSELRRLGRLATIVGEHERIHARTVDDERPAQAMALCDLEGRILLTSEGHPRWLTEACRERVACATVTLARSEPVCLVLPGLHGQPERLKGEEGDRILWRFVRMQRPRRDPLAALSPQQARVAGYAAAGATAAEIARALSISAHTARQHLKAVYRELGTRNRVDLAALLDPTPQLGAGAA